jgi:hypothetical protein
MFPNHQHPRHTDLPIHVPGGGATATFAWNYGGIRGISPENFDENHSFLTQLSFYDNNCSGVTPTGTGTGITGTPTGTGLTGEPTGSGVGGGIVLNPPWWRPGGGSPPWPEPPGPPGLPINVIFQLNAGQPIPFFGQAGFSGDPRITGETFMGVAGTAPIAQFNATPANIGSTTINQGAVGVSTVVPGRPVADPFNATYLPGVVSNYSQNVGVSWNAVNLMGIEGEQRTNPISFNARNVGAQSIDQQDFRAVARPSNRAPGQVQESPPNLGGRHPSISSKPSVSPKVKERFGSDPDQIDIGAASFDQDLADVPGLLSSQLFTDEKGSDLSPTLSLTQIDTSSVMPGSSILLVLGAEEVIHGKPIVVSCSFKPPVGTEVLAYGELYIMDNARRIFSVDAVSSVIATGSAPLVMAGSIISHKLPPGIFTVVAIIKGSDGKVIGVSSRRGAIRKPLSRGSGDSAISRKTSLQIDYDRLPPEILNAGNTKVSEENCVDLMFWEDKSWALIYDKKDTAYNDTISAVLVVDPTKGTDKYKIEIYGNEMGTGALPEEVLHSGALLARSEDRILLDDVELLPHSHTAGVLDSPSTTGNALDQDPMTPSLHVVLGPAAGNSSSDVRRAKFYMSDEVFLKNTTASVANFDGITADITLDTAYVFEELRLVVNGKESGTISSSFTGRSAVTNLSGVATWTGVPITYLDWYTSYYAGNGIFNPYRFAFFTGQLTALPPGAV